MSESSSSLPPAPTLLVIGYGQPQRGDDGVGPHIATLIGALGWPQIRTCSLPQLQPELASRLAIADYAIFVDACKMEPGLEIRVRPLQAQGAETTGSSTPGLGHSCDPQSLLALTQSVYGRHPQSWWIEVPATDFRQGQPLSDLAQAGVQKAIKTIEMLMTANFSAHSGPQAPLSVRG